MFYQVVRKDNVSHEVIENFGYFQDEARAKEVVNRERGFDWEGVYSCVLVHYFAD